MLGACRNIQRKTGVVEKIMGLGSLFRKTRAVGRELVIANKPLCFPTLRDFEFSMLGRTAVPVKRVLVLLKLSPEELAEESLALEEVEKCLLAVLSNEAGATGGLPAKMQELMPSTFSHDNQWHQIFAALRDADGDLDECRRTALIKYIQYLSARQDITKALRHEKDKLRGELPRGALRPAESPVGAGPAFVVGCADREGVAPVRHGRLERLPKGEAVALRLDTGERLDVFLSKHRCNLAGGNPVFFADQANRGYRLTAGRTTVGRDIACDIIMDGSLRDVSRLHLVIGIDANSQLHLTDMSSHGTLVEAKHLRREQPPEVECQTAPQSTSAT